MAIADDRQRVMPSAEDLMPDRSVQLAYPEAHLLTNPIEPALIGEVCKFPVENYRPFNITPKLTF